MNIDLSGKTALVTGSTAGIGFATARGLAESGAHVIVNGRSQASVDNALASLKKSYPTAQATGFAGDLTDAAVCDTLVNTHPAVDILVNNLGIFEPKDFFDIPDSDWTRFSTSTCCPAYASRAPMPRAWPSANGAASCLSPLSLASTFRSR
jgi:NAD(P)-dependent dehydrogenase (short-subunit alcohol dehydrogenase family)